MSNAAVATCTIVVEECCICGIPYGVTSAFQGARRRDHKLFYCPNGHNQHYPQETREEKLQKSLDEANRRTQMERNRREAAERQISAQKAVNTKLKKRAASGVCPCCNRTFSQVVRHMQRKHPDYLEEHGVRAVLEEIKK